MPDWIRPTPPERQIADHSSGRISSMPVTARIANHDVKNTEGLAQTLFAEKHKIPKEIIIKMHKMTSF